MAFIAYFDYLGFQDFIERNESEYQRKIIENNFLIIENAISKGKLKEIPEGYTPDLNDTNINCLNFSDTVILWSQEESVEILQEILQVSFTFSWSCILYTFPIRGTLIRGDMLNYSFGNRNESGVTYSVNSLYGKAIVEAYLKTEKQQWAGTIIDQSIINYLSENNINIETFLNPFAKRYRIPYKPDVISEGEEWAMKLGEIKEKLNKEAFNNMKHKIIDNFSNHNKRVDSEAVVIKIENTIRFLESFA